MSQTPARLAGGAAFALLLLAQHASAANHRYHNWSSTAVCEAPLPVYDATLRKRPLGIANEGAATIFISCSLPADYYADTDDGQVNIYFTSPSANTPVSCTMAAGNRISGVAYQTKSAVIPGGNSGLVSFTDVSRVSEFGSLNFSCNLPAALEMNLLISYQFDAGNAI